MNQRIRRVWWSIAMLFIRNSYKRADYCRTRGIFYSLGDNVSLQISKIPLYPKLIKFHNNIAVARNVDFVTHDVIHGVLNHTMSLNRERTSTERNGVSYDKHTFHEHIGCIEVLDNVFIGSNSIILDGVRIGPNAIIASGSVVTKDVEPDSVVAGVPAKKIGSFSEFSSFRAKAEQNDEIAVTDHNQNITEKEIANAWNIFLKEHEAKVIEGKQ